MRPKLLDLFCGAGGCAMGYHRAGFDVVGVDIKPQPRYPFPMVVANALQPPFDLGVFDAIHASPPCQAFSTMKVMPNARKHEDLLTPTKSMLDLSGLPWIIENVCGSPITIGHAPLFEQSCGLMLCGTMFNLNNGSHELRRHRLFECSFFVPSPSCRHRLPVIGFYGDHARTRQRTVGGHPDRGGDITGNERKMPLVRDLMGIDWMIWDEAKLAIPPAYTVYIGKHLMSVIGVQP